MPYLLALFFFFPNSNKDTRQHYGCAQAASAASITAEAPALTAEELFRKGVALREKKKKEEERKKTPAYSDVKWFCERLHRMCWYDRGERRRQLRRGPQRTINLRGFFFFFQLAETVKRAVIMF